MKERNLLVITSGFPNNKHSYECIFVREQILFLKKYFNNIYVIRPQYKINPTFDFFNLFPVSRKEKPNRKEYSIDNIKVFFPIVSFIPFIKNKNIFNFIEKKGLEFSYIHSHFLYPGGELGNSIAKKYNVNHYCTVHGFDIYILPFKNLFWNIYCKIVASKIHKFVTVSKRNVECLINLGVDRKKILNYGNGYNPSKFYAIKKSETKNLKSKLKLKSTGKTLLTVGNLLPIKNHEFLIDVVSELVNGGMEVSLYIIGDGPLRKYLKKKIKVEKIESYVFLIGSINNEELVSWYNCADLFILTSLDEGNPGVLLESLGCGVPVVTSNVGGVSEVIDHGKNGFIFPVNDKNKCMSAIEQALGYTRNSSDLMRSVEKNTWKYIANLLNNMYHE